MVVHFEWKFKFHSGNHVKFSKSLPVHLCVYVCVFLYKLHATYQNTLKYAILLAK